MGSNGGVNFDELKKLQARLENAQNEIPDLGVTCAKELARRLLAKVVKRTPVGIYKKGTGKTGGTLRRNWEVGSVTKNGSLYKIEVINPIHYASYVEYGHRKRGGKGWVNGRFMLTISEKELKAEAPKIIEKKVTAILKRALNDS